MRILGLDVGDKTIGIAVSDELLMTAQGVETIRRKGLKSDLIRLTELMQRYEADRLVFGWPKNMNGTEGERCEIVRAFAEEAAQNCPKAKHIFWDERLSTVAADRALIAADVSRAKRKKVIDKMAAVFILQGYLDSLPREGRII